LYAQAPGTQLQIGALCFFEAAPLRDRQGRLRHKALSSHVAARLATLPRFRQRIVPVLGDVATPMWVDDPDFQIHRHVRHVVLPAPGGPDALREFVDGLLAEPMDSSHPLWDIHSVDGIGDMVTAEGELVDVIAVVLRAHHVLADGIALHAAATLLLDTEPRPYRAQPHHWSPQPAPGALGLTSRAVAERTRRQLGFAVDATRTLADPRRILPNARFAAQVLGSVRGGASPIAPSLPFTGSIGRRRGFAWDSLSMSDILAVKQVCGATVNDVVLAAVTGALRRQLESTDSFDPDGREPRALIPIGDRDSTATSSNRFSMTTVTLPVTVEDPLERVRVIHARMQASAASPARSMMPHVFSVADVVPPPVLRALATRILARQPLVNVAVSNIPGSRTPLFLWQSPMLALHPFIDVVGNVALIIGVLSYVDGLGVGITVDPDIAGDPHDVVGHLRAAVAEMAALIA
ncbi:MAG: wax ester/triacylglycerol synthase family O-acyltransferase, partial [Actinobacteria bacterium]|nr:wax ester/triacylglycerol synthase family O-acyltransferase [Actinomycetota bacterium]